MSYDVAVYAPRALGPDELVAAVRGTRGLEVDGGASGTLVVLRGARGRYCFTVEGPFDLEAEDVPEEVTARVLGAAHLYTVSVEGSAGSEVSHAIRFARGLAHGLEGAVLDQQTGEVWARAGGRSTVRPEREQRISTLDVDWYVQRERLAPDAARRFVTAATRFLPESLPRRFGEFEPLQGSYADAGPGGFDRAWRDARSLFFWKGSGPCLGGVLGDGLTSPNAPPIWRMGLTFHVEPFRDPRWREGLRGLLVSLADELPAFYASVEVTRGHLWGGRAAWHDAACEHPATLTSRRGWLGLPPRPVWWSWFGAPYADVVAPLLAPERTTPTATGLLHRAAEEPADRGQLESAQRDLLSPDLLATPEPGWPDGGSVPLRRAERVPDGLEWSSGGLE